MLAIALYGAGVDEVLIVDGSRRPMPENALCVTNEHAALDAFCDRIAQIDPDVLTGWNLVDFDLSVLETIAMRVRHPLNLGRDPGTLRIRKAEGYFGSGNASIPGRLVLDGIDLLRGAFVRMDDYFAGRGFASGPAKERQWLAMSRIASAKSSTIIATILPPLPCMRAPMRGLLIKSSNT